MKTVGWIKLAHAVNETDTNREESVEEEEVAHDEDIADEPEN